MEKENKLASLLEMFVLHKKEVLTSLAIVGVGLGLGIGYFQSGPSAETFAEAKAAFAKWEAAPEDEVLYQEMKKTLWKASSLDAKYEPLIGQKLLDLKKTDEALGLVSKSLRRTRGEAPFHALFGETSILIEQGAHQQALERAVALKEQMSRSLSFSADVVSGGSVLYAYNLIRIASLQQALKNGPGERSAWGEIEELFQSKKALAELVLSSFSEKQMSLMDYIDERKKQSS